VQLVSQFELDMGAKAAAETAAAVRNPRIRPHSLLTCSVARSFVLCPSLLTCADYPDCHSHSSLILTLLICDIHSLPSGGSGEGQGKGGGGGGGGGGDTGRTHRRRRGGGEGRQRRQARARLGKAWQMLLATSSTPMSNPRFLSQEISYVVASKIYHARCPLPHRDAFETSFTESSGIL